MMLRKQVCRASCLQAQLHLVSLLWKSQSLPARHLGLSSENIPFALGWEGEREVGSLLARELAQGPGHQPQPDARRV